MQLFLTTLIVYILSHTFHKYWKHQLSADPDRLLSFGMYIAIVRYEVLYEE